MAVEWLERNDMEEEIKPSEEIKPPVCRTILEYMLYKIDRTTAIVGLIFIAGLCTWAGYRLGVDGKDFPESVSKVLTLFFNSMGLYLGFRLGNK